MPRPNDDTDSQNGDAPPNKRNAKDNKKDDRGKHIERFAAADEVMIHNLHAQSLILFDSVLVTC
jgi:hypothetical protein